MHFYGMLIVMPRTDNEEDGTEIPSQFTHPVEPTPSYDEDRKDPPNDGDGRREQWDAQYIDARSKSRDDSQSDSSNGEDNGVDQGIKRERWATDGTTSDRDLKT
eukprot:5009730-Amphidinium_carterae.1